MILDPREKIRERLTICLSLFVFSATFSISIQDFLPYRSSLSFPELLLSNLIVSIALFGIFSIFQNQTGQNGSGVVSWLWDLLSSCISFLIFVGLVNVTLTGTAPSVSMILGCIIYPSYLYGHFSKLLRIPAEEKPKLPLRHKFLLLLALLLLLLPLIGYVALVLRGE